MQIKGSRFSVEEIYDVKGENVLHKVIQHNPDDTALKNFLGRNDISSPQEFLQCATIEIPPGHEFQAHIHLERTREFANLRAQESWVVIEGVVEVDYFGEDGSFLCTRKLTRGDSTVSFRGGHGYRALSEGAVVYEFKTGPYEGKEVDKRFI